MYKKFHCSSVSGCIGGRGGIRSLPATPKLRVRKQVFDGRFPCDSPQDYLTLESRVFECTTFASKKLDLGTGVLLAEEEGFEPSRRFAPPTHFPGVPVQPLLHSSASVVSLSKKMNLHATIIEFAWLFRFCKLTSVVGVCKTLKTRRSTQEAEGDGLLNR